MVRFGMEQVRTVVPARDQMIKATLNLDPRSPRHRGDTVPEDRISQNRRSAPLLQGGLQVLEA